MNSRSSNLIIRSLLGGYLLMLVFLPLGAVFLQAWSGGWSGFWQAISLPAAIFALKLSLSLALLAALSNTLMGTLTAYALVRYRLPGKTILNALVDMPFAVPTAVSGIMLLILYGPRSPLGEMLSSWHIEVVYAWPGIVLAMMFVTFPFTVRAVQPLLLALDKDMEEAAWTLGANRSQVFARIVLPVLWPGILSGFFLCFARALAEFGSIILVAGNIPLQSQVASVYIFGEVESGNLAAASAVSLVLLAAPLLLSWLQTRIYPDNIKESLTSMVQAVREGAA